MATFDYPDIDESRDIKENIRQIKNYLTELSDILNITLNHYERRIEKLEGDVNGKEK